MIRADTVSAELSRAYTLRQIAQASHDPEAGAAARAAIIRAQTAFIARHGNRAALPFTDGGNE